jgi:hypothetical protein
VVKIEKHVDIGGIKGFVASNRAERAHRCRRDGTLVRIASAG